MNLQQIKIDVDNGVLVSPATWHALLDYAINHMASETDLCALLPGVYYMDPPDGGSPTVMEQLRRMAEDAAAFRDKMWDVLPAEILALDEPYGFDTSETLAFEMALELAANLVKERLEK